MASHVAFEIHISLLQIKYNVFNRKVLRSITEAMNGLVGGEGHHGVTLPSILLGKYVFQTTHTEIWHIIRMDFIRLQRTLASRFRHRYGSTHRDERVLTAARLLLEQQKGTNWRPCGESRPLCFEV
jgi:hypothetical protein